MAASLLQIRLMCPQEARKSLVRDSIVHLAKLQRDPKYRFSEISRPFRTVRDPYRTGM